MEPILCWLAVTLIARSNSELLATANGVSYKISTERDI